MVLSKKQSITAFACLLISLAAYQLTLHSQTDPQVRLLTSSYTTSSTRTTSVNAYCSGLSRTSLVDSTLTSQYNFYSSQMSSMFSLNGTSFIMSLFNGDSESAKTQAQSNAVQLALFVGPFLLGLVLIILMGPFVMCCCVCPSSCPSRCCRKNEDQQYTKCQLYWPVGTLITALLLCIGASIAGFSQSQAFPQALTSMGCASSIILDDLLNGNVTTDGSSFFVGLNQLDTQLGNLNSNLTTIQNTMNNLVPGAANITAVNNAGSTALTDVAKVPANVDAGGNMAAITYNTPLNSGATTGTTGSIFPTVLGSSTTGGLVGTLYTTINAVLSALSVISTAASNFVSEVANFSSAIASVRGQVQDIASSITSLQASFSTTMGTVDSRSGDVHLGVRLLYGITIGISSLMLLGALLVAFCDKINCRYLIYLSCVLVFILGVVGFALSLIFSLVVPTVYFGCQFMETSLSSSTSFDSTFASLITNSTIRGYMGTCLSSSSGNIVDAIGGGTVNALNNLSSSLTNINTFNVSQQSSNVLSDLSSMTSYITYYQNGVITDLNDSSSTSILTYLSKQSNYPGCTTGLFSTDSWIPSYSQSPTYAGCQISGGNNATSTQCGGANFAAGSGGCDGCMDTTSILNIATYATKASVLTALGNRYTAGGCSTFNNELANTWQNYYLVKSNAFSPVVSRGSTATTSVNQFSANLTGTLNTTLTNAVNTLAAAASNVTDPKYGLIAGLNCRLIGQDLSTFTTTFCHSFFTVSYFNRITLGCSAFGLLFSMCCGVCTGVRFYKHSIRKLNSVQNEGLSEEDVQDITNTNFVKPKVLE